MGVLTVLEKASKFTNDAAGVEKSLRFLQSIAQVAAAYSITAIDAAPWLQARKQFALGRRYLRIFKFFDAFQAAFDAFSNSTGLISVLEVGKWSCLGMYLFLESCTIMDSMEIWSQEWAPMVFVEAMRFWFYSLSCSILISVLQLISLHSAKPPTQEKVKTTEKEGKTAEASDGINKEAREKALKSRSILKRLATDVCDLTIPGAITGWIVTSSATVGIASATSTILASTDIWERVQRQ